jgi:hypothetical protein
MRIQFPLHILSNQTLDIFTNGLKGQGLEVAPKFSRAWISRLEGERFRRLRSGPTEESFEIPDVSPDERIEVLTCFANSADYLPVLAEQVAVTGEGWPREQADRASKDMILAAELCRSVKNAIEEACG